MNYITPPLANLVAYEFVYTLIAGITLLQHEAVGFGVLATYTRHILQFPAIFSL